MPSPAFLQAPSQGLADQCSSGQQRQAQLSDYSHYPLMAHVFSRHGLMPKRSAFSVISYELLKLTSWPVMSNSACPSLEVARYTMTWREVRHVFILWAFLESHKRPKLSPCGLRQAICEC